MCRKVNKGNHNRLKAKLKRSSICYHCGITVKKSYGGAQDDDAATVDHIYSRYEIIRMLIDSKYPELRHKHTVLSCYKCNKDRNDRRQEEINKIFNPSGVYEEINLLDYCDK